MHSNSSELTRKRSTSASSVNPARTGDNGTGNQYEGSDINTGTQTPEGVTSQTTTREEGLSENENS